MMRDPCRTYRRALVLGELDETTSAHPTGCSACRRHSELEHEVAGALARHRAMLVPPEALRERLASTLAAERSRVPWHRALVRPVLVAALLVIPLVAGLLLWLGRPDGKERADLLADIIVEDHLKYAHRADRLQIADASPAQMQAWFERELAIAAKLPALRGATLVGGRRCKLGERRAALAFYEHLAPDGTTQPLSLFVFEPRGEDWSGMHEVKGVAGKRVCRHHDRGVGLLVWQERALVYVIAGALETEELAQLIESGN